MAREKKLEIKVTPDGGASIDPEELFRKLFEEPAEREALKRLSAAAQIDSPPGRGQAFKCCRSRLTTSKT